MTKILDMIPDVIEKFGSKGEDKMTEKDVDDILNEAEAAEDIAD